MKRDILGLMAILLMLALPLRGAVAGPITGTTPPGNESAREALPQEGPKELQAPAPDAALPADQAVDKPKGAAAVERLDKMLSDPGAQPSRPETLQDLQRSMLNEAFHGLQEEDAKPSAQGAVPQGHRPAAGDAPAEGTPESIVELHRAIGDLIQVDAVNGLGDPIGLKNSIVEGVKSAEALGADLAAQSAQWQEGGGLDRSTTAQSAEGNSSSKLGQAVGILPSWVSAVFDTFALVTNFINNNKALLLALFVLTLGAVSMGRLRR